LRHMSSTISEHWLAYFVVPLAGCSISLLTWRVLVRRGWDRILPVLNLYVVFSCLTSVILLPLFYLQLNPGAFQQISFRVYAGGYQVSDLLIPLLLAAAIVELTKHMSGQNIAARRAYTVAVTGGMVGLATLTACVLAFQGGVPANSILKSVLSFVSRATSLIIIGLVLRLLVVNRRLLGLRSNLTLVAIIVGAYYVFEIVGSFIIFRRGGAAGQSVVFEQTLWLAYATAFYWVLAREPRTPREALAEC
jgi:hypothetical protein